LLSSIFLLALGYYYLRLRHRPATWLGGAGAEDIVHDAK
jgi:hypothetical protein